MPPTNAPVSSPMPAPASAQPAANPGGYVSNVLALVKPSFEGVKLNGLTYLLAVMAIAGYFVVVGIVVFLSFALGGALGILIGGLLVLAGLILGLIYLGPPLYRLTTAMARHQKVELKDVFKLDVNMGVRLLAAQVLTGLIVVVGFICLIVPGVIFLVWFSMVPYVVVNENLGPVEALKRSRELARNRFWDVAATVSIVSAISIVTIVPVLGFLVELVLGVILIPVMAIRYLQLVELKASGDGKGIATDPWNYGIIALAIVASFVSSHYGYHYTAPTSSVDKTTIPY